jgi:tetratricopeptide (TPR) repeat protein
MPPPNIFQRPAPRVAAPLPAGVLLEVRRALMLHQSGRVAEAVAIYQAVLRAHPQQFECLHYLGVAHLQGGRHAQALPLLEAAHKLAASDPSLQAEPRPRARRLGRHAEALRQPRPRARAAPRDARGAETTRAGRCTRSIASTRRSPASTTRSPPTRSWPRSTTAARSS